jgi:hypothetical protein
MTTEDQVNDKIKGLAKALKGHMTATHMPTPCYEVSTWTYGQVCIKSPRGLIALMEAGNDEARKHDAAFIVRAVNAHEAMREALEGALKDIAMLRNRLEQEGVDTGDYEIDLHDYRTALALASDPPAHRAEKGV